MFIEGIKRIDQIISEEQRLAIKAAIQQTQAANGLTVENDIVNYKNSYGTSSIPAIESYFEYLTPIVESITKLKLSKENSFARIYNEGSTLNPHYDREGLDITLSIQIENTTGFSQPLYSEQYGGPTITAVLQSKDGLLIKGRDLKHWRDPVRCFNPEGTLTCVFFHWQIMANEYLEIDNFLQPSLCDLVIEEAEVIGFERSKVISSGENREDHYSRSSSTQWFRDTYHLSELVRKAIPTIGNLRLEGWQLVKYVKTEEFKHHQDCLGKENDRLFTIILYLNDNFLGGKTNFSATGQNIDPKQGKLVIWKNLISDKCNPKSMHAGMPVEEGTKYILVNWSLSSK